MRMQQDFCVNQGLPEFGAGNLKYLHNNLTGGEAKIFGFLVVNTTFIEFELILHVSYN